MQVSRDQLKAIITKLPQADRGGSAHEEWVIGQQRLEITTSRSDHTERAKRHAEAMLQQFVLEIEWMLAVRWEE